MDMNDLNMIAGAAATLCRDFGSTLLPISARWHSEPSTNDKQDGRYIITVRHYDGTQRDIYGPVTRVPHGWSATHGAKTMALSEAFSAIRHEIETTPLQLHLPEDVIEAAQQRALELSADMCRHVSRQEVYRGLVAGELAPLATDGAGPLASETMRLTSEQSVRLHACAVKLSLSLPGAADFLCRNAEF
jgi:hypothetical protein